MNLCHSSLVCMRSLCPFYIKLQFLCIFCILRRVVPSPTKKTKHAQTRARGASWWGSRPQPPTYRAPFPIPSGLLSGKGPGSLCVCACVGCEGLRVCIHAPLVCKSPRKANRKRLSLCMVFPTPDRFLAVAVEQMGTITCISRGIHVGSQQGGAGSN